ncbi:MAG: T9SS type A sorting domain-containing protein [Bacteroidota bacterium]
MKKIILLMVAIVMTAGAFAQQFNQGALFLNPVKFSGAKAIDTLYPPSMTTLMPCGDSLTYYSTGTGYLTGNGSLGTSSITEVGQGYTCTGTVNEILAVCGRLTGGTGSVSASIYGTTAGSFVPTGTALGTSSTILTSAISNTSFSLCSFTFSPAVSVNGNFAATITLPTVAGDTVVVGGTRMGCVATGQDKNAVFKCGTWATYYSVLSAASYGSIDLDVFPIANVASGISENQAAFTMYPNPATNMFIISSTEKVNAIKVMDIYGHLIYQDMNTENLFMVNTEAFATGAYFVSIETAKGKFTKKLMISK